MSDATCFRCKAAPARAGSRFCSESCGSAEGEERTAGYAWCEACGRWKPYWARCAHLLETLGHAHIGAAVRR